MMAEECKVKGVKGNKTSSGNPLVKFCKGIKAEFKRITWASKKETKKAAITVLVFCLIFMVLIGVLDFGFNNLFKLVFRVQG